MEKTINVVYTQLDPEVRGLTKKNRDLSYTIVLNSMHCAEVLETTYEHELAHIKNGHYDNDSKQVIEMEKEVRENNDTIPLFSEDQGKLLLQWVLGSKKERVEIEKRLDRINTKMPPIVGIVR